MNRSQILYLVIKKYLLNVINRKNYIKIINFPRNLYIIKNYTTKINK